MDKVQSIFEALRASSPEDKKDKRELSEKKKKAKA